MSFFSVLFSTIDGLEDNKRVLFVCFQAGLVLAGNTTKDAIILVQHDPVPSCLPWHNPFLNLGSFQLLDKEALAVSPHLQPAI